MKEYWKTLAVSITGFIGVITTITVLNNFNGIMAMEFCGQLQDFGGGPAHTGCLSFPEYWLRAVLYWPYTLSASLIGVGLGWTYRNLSGE